MEAPAFPELGPIRVILCNEVNMLCVRHDLGALCCHIIILLIFRILQKIVVFLSPLKT